MNYKLTYKRGEKKVFIVFAPPENQNVPVTLKELKDWFRLAIGTPGVKNGFYPRKVSMPHGENAVHQLISLKLTDERVDDAYKRTIAQILNEFVVQSLGGW